MLSVTTAVEAALADPDAKFGFLIDLPGPLRLTDWFKDVVYDSNTYESSGVLLAARTTGVQDGIKVHSITLTLDNVDQTALGIYGNGTYQGDEATIYLALFDDDDDLIPDPLIHFKGTLDTWAVEESTTTSKLQVKITSHEAKYNAKKGRFTNDSSQQEAHPGDEFFKYAHQDKGSIRWGTPR